MFWKTKFKIQFKIENMHTEENVYALKNYMYYKWIYVSVFPYI